MFFCRIQSGPLIGVALDILGTKDIRDLDLQERMPNFRKLEKSLRRVMVKITVGPSDRRRRISGLIPAAGRFEFSKDGRPMTVQVNNSLDVSVCDDRTVVLGLLQDRLQFSDEISEHCRHYSWLQKC
jgi:hypothetical protein